jgi:hypothetical protein
MTALHVLFNATLWRRAYSCPGLAIPSISHRAALFSCLTRFSGSCPARHPARLFRASSFLAQPCPRTLHWRWLRQKVPTPLVSSLQHLLRDHLRLRAKGLDSEGQVALEALVLDQLPKRTPRHVTINRPGSSTSLPNVSDCRMRMRLLSPYVLSEPHPIEPWLWVSG